jgi:hypothetical protein
MTWLANKQKRRRPGRRQGGMALVVVLGAVSLFAVLAAMMITSSQTAKLITVVNIERSQMKYAAESALAYGQWMVMSDRRRFPNRRLGARDIQREAEDVESWMADGKSHFVWVTDDILAEVQVKDAAQGWDFSSLQAVRQTKTTFMRTLDEHDDERREQLEIFFDILEDYLDPNDQQRLNGMEEAEYEGLGIYDFPRNDSLSLREEVYWLPHIETLIPGLGDGALPPQDLVRIVPPPNVRKFTGKPALFSSSSEVIRTAANLDSLELSNVRACIQEWYANKTPLNECLDPQTYQKVSSAMSLQAMGVYTFHVKAGYENGDVTRSMVATIDLRKLPAKSLPYWQKVVY